MARPAFSICSIVKQALQTPTGVRLEIVHYFLRLNLCLHDHMHMIRPNMRRQQTPAPVQADFPQGLQYRRAAAPVEQIGA